MQTLLLNVNIDSNKRKSQDYTLTKTPNLVLCQLALVDEDELQEFSASVLKRDMEKYGYENGDVIHFWARNNEPESIIAELKKNMDLFFRFDLNGKCEFDDYEQIQQWVEYVLPLSAISMWTINDANNHIIHCLYVAKKMLQLADEYEELCIKEVLDSGEYNLI